MTWHLSINGPSGTVSGTASVSGQVSLISSLPYMLDLTNGLNLVLIGASIGEEYGINGIDVTVSGSLVAVPVPAGFPLLLGALGAAALLRRSRS